MLFFYMNPILIAAAVIPAIVLLVKVYRADKLEKEPPGLLFSLVIYGIIATGFAAALERLGMFLLNRLFPAYSLTYQLLLYFAVVGLSEEGLKYLLLKKCTWHSPHFNCRFDGVVYAVFVSLGFALWENIGYVLRYGFSTAMIRAVTAVPGHACFGVFMGAWYGIAKKYEFYGREELSRLYRFLAVLLPVLLHGTYDFIASYEYTHFAWVFVAFVVVLFAISFLLIRRMSNHDQYINNNRRYFF